MLILKSLQNYFKDKTDQIFNKRPTQSDQNPEVEVSAQKTNIKLSQDNYRLLLEMCRQNIELKQYNMRLKQQISEKQNYISQIQSKLNQVHRKLEELQSANVIEYPCPTSFIDAKSKYFSNFKIVKKQQIVNTRRHMKSTVKKIKGDSGYTMLLGRFSMQIKPKFSIKIIKQGSYPIAIGLVLASRSQMLYKQRCEDNNFRIKYESDGWVFNGRFGEQSFVKYRQNDIINVEYDQKQSILTWKKFNTIQLNKLYICQCRIEQGKQIYRDFQIMPCVWLWNIGDEIQWIE